MRTAKRLCSWLLLVTMLLGFIPNYTIKASAAPSNLYLLSCIGAAFNKPDSSHQHYWVTPDSEVHGVTHNYGDNYTAQATSGYRPTYTVSIGGTLYRLSNPTAMTIPSTRYASNALFFAGEPGQSILETSSSYSWSSAVMQKCGRTNDGTNGKGYYVVMDNVSVSSLGGLSFSITFTMPWMSGSYAKVGITAAFRYDVVPASGGGPGTGGGGGYPSYPDPVYPTYPPYVPTLPPQPTPQPVPQPSIANVNTTLSVTSPTSAINYKTGNGNVSATAVAYDTSTYRDYGKLNYSEVALQSFNNYTTQQNYTQRGSSTAKLEANIGNDISWASSIENGKKYEFVAQAQGSVYLDNSSSIVGPVVNKKGTFEIVNQKPTVEWNLKTVDQNGAEVKEGYYYTNTPARLDAKFIDPEKDIYRAYLAIGKQEYMSNNMAEFICSINYSDANSTGDDNTLAEASVLFENGNISASNWEKRKLDEIITDLTFQEPGIYAYKILVTDACSNLALYQEDEKEGTFEVRGNPQPPTAIISSPAFAFEDDPFYIRQASTDPNDDIVKWEWQQPKNTTGDKNASGTLTGGTIDAYKMSSEQINKIINNLGGKITFPTGSRGNMFEIKLTVTDATGYTDTETQLIKVISNLPVPSIEVEPNPDNIPDEPEDNPGTPDNPPSGSKNHGETDKDRLKENRLIILSAKNSIYPKNYPVNWDKDAQWTVTQIEDSSGRKVSNNINPSGSGIWSLDKGNNQICRLQFREAGKYEVKLHLENDYSKKNPTDKDINATTTSMIITVIKDEDPESSVKVTSGQPDFGTGETKNEEHTVKFKVSANSIDGDFIGNTGVFGTDISKTYNWQLFEDNGGTYTPVTNKVPMTISSDGMELSYITKFRIGQHNKYKAVVTTNETKVGHTDSDRWDKDSSSPTYHLRDSIAEIETVVNWKPDVGISPINPDTGFEIPKTDDPNSPTDPSNPGDDTYLSDGTVIRYGKTDLNGDGIIDGDYIRIYEGDTIHIKTKVTDELPDKCNISWTLEKMDHKGQYSANQPSGGTWLRSSYVTSKLANKVDEVSTQDKAGYATSTIAIKQPGIYRLTSTVKDDCGSTNKAYIYIRVYMIPIGVLESNPDYQYYNDEWTTKENIRFDLRSNPTIIDDEWGKAWHQMNWDKDSWKIIGSYTQEVADSPNRQETSIVDPDNISKQGVKVSAGQSIEASKEVHVMDSRFTSDENTYTSAGVNESSDLYTFAKSLNDPRLGFGGEGSAMIDIIAISGLNSINGTPIEMTKYSDGRLIIKNHDDSKFNEAIDNLVNKLKENESRYDIVTYKKTTVSTTDGLFRTVNNLGYFCGADADLGTNYTVQKFIDYTDTTGHNGTNCVVSGIGAITNASDKEKGKNEIIELHVVKAYDSEMYKNPTEEQLKNMVFDGSAKVYMRTGVIPSEIVNMPYNTDAQKQSKNEAMREFFNTGSWIELGTYNTATDNLDDLFIATIKRATENGKVIWTLKSEHNDTTLKIPADSDLQFKVEFTGTDGVSTIHVNPTVLGVCGNYKDDHKQVTTIKTIEEVLKEIDARGKNSTKYIIYGTNINTDIQEFHSETYQDPNNPENTITDPIKDREAIKKLQEYISTRNKQGDNIHLIVYGCYGDPADLFIENVPGCGLSTGADVNTAISGFAYNYISSQTVVLDNNQWRAFAFTEPGRYELTYVGTNYGSKSSKPVTYVINVKEDEPPKVAIDVSTDKWVRETYDESEKVSMTNISLTGPYSATLKKQVPTVYSTDGDKIESVDMKLYYDKDNNNTFDSNDITWELIETGSNGSTVDKTNTPLTRALDILGKPVLRKYILNRLQ